MTLDHVGIAVRSIEESAIMYQRMLLAELGPIETLPKMGVKAAFIHLGKQKIELIESLTEVGPVAKFIEKRGEGMHHVAYLVDDILCEMERLGEAGYRLLQEEPSIGVGGKLVCFLHPKSTGGVLTELVQYPESSEEE